MTGSPVLPSLAFPRKLRLFAEGPCGFRPAKKRDFACLWLGTRANELGHPRLGIRVAKRFVKGAVDRNRLKRMVRETFRLYQHQLPALDIVVSAKEGVSKRSCDEVRQQLTQMWTLCRR